MSHHTLITNISTNALTLPPPYLAAVPAGKAVIVADDITNVSRYLGTQPGLWRITVDPTDADVPTIFSTNPNTTIVTLTSAQVLALNATPIILVPAAGVGNVIIPVSVTAYLKFGTNAFTEVTGAEVLTVQHAGGNPIFRGGNNATFIQATASTLSDFNIVPAVATSFNESKTASDNVALTVSASNAITGNAAGDNFITIVTTYVIHSPGTYAGGW